MLLHRQMNWPFLRSSAPLALAVYMHMPNMAYAYKPFK